MRWLGALVVVAVLALCAPAQAQAKVACGDGTTAFVDGNLRIFGIHYRTADEWGFDAYACLGRRRPLAVGGVGSTTGTGSAVTPVYAHAGRFLATYHQSDGEGGPSAHVSVVDLVRRRSVAFVNVACCEWTPAIRLAPDGTVAVNAPGEGVFVKRPGRRARTLAAEGSGARDLAMHGGTLYWTEGGDTRTATLDGVGGGEAQALEPVRMRRGGGRCAAAPGRTIVASGSVRVYETGDGRFGCRIGGPTFALAGSTPPRIVADRWLLVFGEGTARVIDSRTGSVRQRARKVADATLLANGHLAWIGFDGFVRIQVPGNLAATIGSGGATGLAAARRTIYWTEESLGARHYRPGERFLPD